MEGAVALQQGEDAVLHGQRPEGLLSLLLLRQARRRLRLRHGDRGPDLPGSRGEARGRSRPRAAEAGPAIRAHGQGTARPVRCARGGGAAFRGSARGARWARGARSTPSGAGCRRDDAEGVPHRLRAERQGRAQGALLEGGLHRGAAPGRRPPHQARRRPRPPTIASATGSPSPFSTPSRASSPSAPARSMPAPSRNI